VNVCLSPTKIDRFHHEFQANLTPDEIQMIEDTINKELNTQA